MNKNHLKIVLGLTLTCGWSLVFANNFASAEQVVTPAPVAEVKPSAAPTKEKKLTLENKKPATTVQKKATENVDAYVQSTSSPEFNGLQLDAAYILLTDRRPRVSTSKFGNLIGKVKEFQGLNSVKSVQILYPHDTPEKHVDTLAKFMGSYFGVAVEKVEASEFKVLLKSKMTKEVTQ